MPQHRGTRAAQPRDLLRSPWLAIILVSVTSLHQLFGFIFNFKKSELSVLQACNALGGASGASVLRAAIVLLPVSARSIAHVFLQSYRNFR